MTRKEPIEYSDFMSKSEPPQKQFTGNYRD